LAQVIPRSFESHLDPYPGKPLPFIRGTGFGRWGYGYLEGMKPVGVTL